MGQNRGWRGRSWAALSSNRCAQPNVKPRQPRCSEWICLTLLDTNCLSVVFLSPDNQLPEQFNRLKREHSFLHTKEHHWLPGCYLLHANATGYYSWCQCHQSCAQRVHGLPAVEFHIFPTRLAVSFWPRVRKCLNVCLQQFAAAKIECLVTLAKRLSKQVDWAGTAFTAGPCPCMQGKR